MSNRYDGLQIIQIDPTITGGLVIEWACPRIGFGELTLWWENGKLHADTECMSKEFVSLVLSKIADEIVVEG